MPCDYSKYPSNWQEIRNRILERAAHKCERCRRPNREHVFVWKNGWWYRDTKEELEMRTDEGMQFESEDLAPDDEPRLVKTVLTISHTDQDLANNEDSNLRALCQRCHLRHDAAQHAASAAITRRQNKEKRQEAAGVFSLPL